MRGKSNSTKNVLLLNNNLYLGGSNILIQNMLSLLKNKHNYNFLPCLVGKNNQRSFKKHNFGKKIVYINKNYPNPLVLIDLIKLIKKKDIDIIHANSPASYIFGLIAKFLTQRKAIIHLHGSLKHDSQNNNFIKKIIRLMLFNLLADYFIVVCNSLKRELINDYHIKPSKIKVISNGICDIYKKPINGALKEHLINKYSLNDSLVILNIGRLVEVKNQKLLILLGERIKKETNINYKILIVGNGPLRKSLKKLIESKQLKNTVHLLGEIENQNINTILSLADIFVLTSFYEGISISLLEALSMGTPCLVSNVGGNKQVIKKFSSGLLFQSDNINDLFSKIMLLYNDKELLKKIGSNGRKRYLEKFNIEISVKLIINIYNMIASVDN